MTANPEDNLVLLKENPYPGRGIVVGLHEDGKQLVQLCWTMGRSPNSRNRVYGEDGGRIFTEAADPSKAGDPSLIIYTAMNEAHPFYVVSNGHQTDALTNGLPVRRGVESILSEWNYEPDAPNFTPRITGALDARLSVACLSLITKDPMSEESVRRFTYPPLKPGLGYCLTTYKGDGNPLPSFEEDPFLVPLLGNVLAIRDAFWAALNPENRVSLAVKMIDPSGRGGTVAIRNQYEKVASA